MIESDKDFERQWQTSDTLSVAELHLKNTAALWWHRGCVHGANQIYELAVKSGVIPDSPEVRAAFERVLSK